MPELIEALKAKITVSAKSEDFPMKAMVKKLNSNNISKEDADWNENALLIFRSAARADREQKQKHAAKFLDSKTNYIVSNTPQQSISNPLTILINNKSK